jgi:hypothetical protein
MSWAIPLHHLWSLIPTFFFDSWVAHTTSHPEGRIRRIPQQGSIGAKSPTMKTALLSLLVAVFASGASLAYADICVSGAGAPEWNGTYVFDVGLGRYDLDGSHVLYNEFGSWVMKNSIGIGNPIAYTGANVDGVPENSTYSVGTIGTAPAPVVSSGACTTPTPTPTVTSTVTPTVTPTPTSTITPTLTSTPPLSPTPTSTPTLTPTPNLGACVRNYQRDELVAVNRSSTTSKRVELTIQLPTGWTTQENLPLSRLTRSRSNSCPRNLGDLIGTRSDDEEIVAVAIPDANGTFRYEVPEGEYDVVFSADDRELVPSRITLSTDNPIVSRSFDVTAINLRDEGCTRKIVTADIKAAMDGVVAQANYAVGLFQKYNTSAGKRPNRARAEAALRKVGLKVIAIRSSTLSNSIEFPTIQLSCGGKATCTSRTLVSSRTKTVAGMKSLQRQTVALARVAKRYLKNISVAAVNKRATKLLQASLKRSKRLPLRTDVCTE